MEIQICREMNLQMDAFYFAFKVSKYLFKNSFYFILLKTKLTRFAKLKDNSNAFQIGRTVKQ